MVSCKVCNATFSRSNNLNAHYREKHQPRQCSECPLLFHGSGALQKHQQAVHGLQKKHACEKCSKPFNRKCDLNRHLLSCKASVPTICVYPPLTFKKEEVVNAKTKAEDLQFNIQTVDKSFQGVAETWRITLNPSMRPVDVLNSLNASVNAMEARIREFLTTNRSMKFIMSICCIFVKDSDPNVKTHPTICLTTQAFDVHSSSVISNVLDMARAQLVNRIDTFESNGSD